MEELQEASIANEVPPTIVERPTAPMSAGNRFHHFIEVAPFVIAPAGIAIPCALFTGLPVGEAAFSAGLTSVCILAMQASGNVLPALLYLVMLQGFFAYFMAPHSNALGILSVVSVVLGWMLGISALALIDRYKKRKTAHEANRGNEA